MEHIARARALLLCLLVASAFALVGACEKEDKNNGSHHVRNCGDVPHKGFGVNLEAETFVCSGKEMKSEPGEGHGPFDELIGMAIRNQATLEDILLRMEEFGGQYPVLELCQVDFATVTILVVGDIAYEGACASISICGVYEDSEKLTAVVFDDKCSGPPMVVTYPFHFVEIPATNKPVEFKYYIYDHYEEG
jgi:hypothetical protein